MGRQTDKPISQTSFQIVVRFLKIKDIYIQQIYKTKLRTETKWWLPRACTCIDSFTEGGRNHPESPLNNNKTARNSEAQTTKPPLSKAENLIRDLHFANFFKNVPLTTGSHCQRCLKASLNKLQYPSK